MSPRHDRSAVASWARHRVSRRHRSHVQCQVAISTAMAVSTWGNGRETEPETGPDRALDAPRGGSDISSITTSCYRFVIVVINLAFNVSHFYRIPTFRMWPSLRTTVIVS